MYSIIDSVLVFFFFRCPVCDRRFSQSSSVTTHMRTHSGERPYRCRLCKKAFSDSSTLTKHLRIHSGEKPYECKLCLLRWAYVTTYIFQGVEFFYCMSFQSNITEPFFPIQFWGVQVPLLSRLLAWTSNIHRKMSSKQNHLMISGKCFQSLLG